MLVGFFARRKMSHKLRKIKKTQHQQDQSGQNIDMSLSYICGVMKTITKTNQKNIIKKEKKEGHRRGSRVDQLS